MFNKTADIENIQKKLNEFLDKFTEIKYSRVSDNAKLEELSKNILDLEKFQKRIKAQYSTYLDEIEELEKQADYVLNIIKEDNKNLTENDIKILLEQRI